MSATATANAPLPTGWSITIFWGGGTICKTATAEVCTATVTFPAGSPNVAIQGQLNSPNGWSGLNIQEAMDPNCNNGKPMSQNGGSC